MRVLPGPVDVEEMAPGKQLPTGRAPRGFRLIDNEPKILAHFLNSVGRERKSVKFCRFQSPDLERERKDVS